MHHLSKLLFGFLHVVGVAIRMPFPVTGTCLLTRTLTTDDNGIVTKRSMQHVLTVPASYTPFLLSAHLHLELLPEDRNICCLGQRRRKTQREIKTLTRTLLLGSSARVPARLQTTDAATRNKLGVGLIDAIGSVSC